MRRKRRLVAALAVAAMCAPGTLLRTDLSLDPPKTVVVRQLADSRDLDEPGWELGGVWEMSGEGLLFGGFSALLALSDGRLQAFSDRGVRFTFVEPDREGLAQKITRQQLMPERAMGVRDIEGAAIDRESGMYWLSFEIKHAIHRFTSDHTPRGVRDLAADAERLGWSYNSGAEAFTRLSDGRFVVIAEGQETGLVWGDDPIKGTDFATFAFVSPASSHAVTDMAQLPDGRLLLLLRNLDLGGGLPPFESKIALGPLPDPGAAEAWEPQLALDLAGIAPRENYEGIAVRPLPDGRVAVWLIADDNLSVIQRTLVVKLLLDPRRAGPSQVER